MNEKDENQLRSLTIEFTPMVQIGDTATVLEQFLQELLEIILDQLAILRDSCEGGTTAVGSSEGLQREQRRRASWWLFRESSNERTFPIALILVLVVVHGSIERGSC